jgi:hypothetical protein
MQAGEAKCVSFLLEKPKEKEDLDAQAYVGG